MTTAEYDFFEKVPHYNSGGIEAIDYMKAKSNKDEYRGYLKLTAIKYLTRMGTKPKVSKLDDVKKVRWFVETLIRDLEERGE